MAKKNKQTTFAERLRLVRERAEMSANGMADSILDMNRSQYRGTEQGIYGLTTEKMQLLADRMHVNIHWLVTGQGDMYYHHAPDVVPAIRLLLQDHLRSLHNPTSEDTELVTLLLRALEKKK